MNKTLLQFTVAAICCITVATTTADDSTVTFWTGIEHQDFGETEDSFVRQNAKQTSAQIGVDARLRSGLLAGLAIHRSELDDTYEFNSMVVFEDNQGAVQRNEYESKSKLTEEMTVLNPYLSWNSSDTTVWLVAGYGEGEIKFAPRTVTVGDVSFSIAPDVWDTHARTIAAGASRLLTPQNDAEWRLKTDVQHARMKWKADNSPARAPLDIKVDSSRLYMAVEAKRPAHSINGIPLAPATQLGVRYHGGNSDGAEVEIDGLMRYRNAPRGLTVEARAWALDGISEDWKDNQQWNISATLRLSRPNWRGLSFSITSGYGSGIIDRNPNAWFHARITYGKTPHPTWTTCPPLRAGC